MMQCILRLDDEVVEDDLLDVEEELCLELELVLWVDVLFNGIANDVAAEPGNDKLVKQKLSSCSGGRATAGVVSDLVLERARERLWLRYLVSTDMVCCSSSSNDLFVGDVSLSESKVRETAPTLSRLNTENVFIV